MAEVILAFTVLAIVMTAAAVSIGDAYRKQRIVREENQAAALADEGAMAIRILRDTNWLRFPGNREGCWDTLDAPNATECSTSNALADGMVYKVDRELTDSSTLMTWNIEAATLAEPNPTDTRLYAKTLGGFTFYGHDSINTTPTPFYRTISITTTPPNEILATSTVTWESYGVARSSEVVRRLKNF